MYEQTKFFAEKALNMSVDAYEQALDLYSQANAIQIPGVDVDQLLAESERIKNEVTFHRLIDLAHCFRMQTRETKYLNKYLMTSIVSVWVYGRWLGFKLLLGMIIGSEIWIFVGYQKKLFVQFLNMCMHYILLCLCFLN